MALTWQCFSWLSLQAIETATDRLTQQLSFAAYVANELLLPPPKDEIHELLMKHEDSHFISIQLNLMNAFLYMVKNYILSLSLSLSLRVSQTHSFSLRAAESVHQILGKIEVLNTALMHLQVNYYIVVPTSNEYAKMLDAPGSLCGVIIGSMPLAALVSAFVYSWWSNFSYKSPILYSSLILMAGNLMYALALYFNSVWLLVLGRFLCG